jgi:hypothetical protein
MVMLAKRPESRFQTPAEAARALERIARFQGMTVEPPAQRASGKWRDETELGRHLPLAACHSFRDRLLGSTDLWPLTTGS